MYIVVNRMQYKNIDGISADVGKFQMNLSVTFDESIPVNLFLLYKFTGFLQKNIESLFIRAVRPLGSKRGNRSLDTLPEFTELL